MPRSKDRLCRVLICDDAIGFSVLASAWLNAEPGLKVIATAHTAAAVDEARRQRPEVIVLDRMLPDVDGFVEVVADLRRSSPDSAIVLTSSLPAVDLEKAGKLVAADATFTKAASSQDLIDAVIAAAQRRSG